MIEGLFTWLSGLVESTLLLALLGAFLWGICSILLSPCHLTSIPLIIGFIGDQGKMKVKRAFHISLAFSFGILLTIGIIGVITSLLGRMMGDIGKWGNYVVAAVFFLVGLYLLDIIPLRFPGLGRIKSKKKGPLAAFLLGFIFGIALGPCTFAFMAPVLAVVLYSSSANLLNGILLLTAYGIGHCLLIVLAGTFTQWVQRYLDWNEKSQGTKILKRICGVLIIIGVIYLLTL
ncbi:MAG: cytochrome C biogenesis protein [Candidatus Aminicenantes bacterium]|nr:cytochrome C biogenesis protein [Candidatus Aminicenantes bacterium]